MALKDEILRILATQSPDYLIQPDASAFAVEGFAPEDVAACLAELEADGHVRQDEIVLMTYVIEPQQVPKLDKNGAPVLDNGVPVLVDRKNANGDVVMIPVIGDDGAPVLAEAKDSNGNPVTADAGWCVTADGAKAHAKRVNNRH